MNPNRYTGLVALNLGMQLALVFAFVEIDARFPRPLPWFVQASFFCLQLPLGWMFRLQRGPYGPEVFVWVVVNAFLWAALWEWILSRYWPPSPDRLQDEDDDDLPPDSPFRNSHPTKEM